MINFELFIQSIPVIAQGLQYTLLISFGGFLIGISLGLFLAFLQFQSKFCNRLIAIYVGVMRGTPMLVQIMFVFYVLPQLGLDLPAVACAILAIGLNSSAYMSQVLLSGIRSISRNQIDAAKILGLSKLQTFYHVILPQAFRVVCPALGNEIVTLVKDSSLASVIGVMEITKQASIIKSQTYDSLTVLSILALFYLSLTLLISYAFTKMTKERGEKSV